MEAMCIPEAAHQQSSQPSWGGEDVAWDTGLLALPFFSESGGHVAVVVASAEDQPDHTGKEISWQDKQVGSSWLAMWQAGWKTDHSGQWSKANRQSPEPLS